MAFASPTGSLPSVAVLALTFVILSAGSTKSSDPLCVEQLSNFLHYLCHGHFTTKRLLAVDKDGSVPISFPEEEVYQFPLYEHRETPSLTLDPIDRLAALDLDAEDDHYNVFRRTLSKRMEDLRIYLKKLQEMRGHSPTTGNYFEGFSPGHEEKQLDLKPEDSGLKVKWKNITLDEECCRQKPCSLADLHAYCLPRTENEQ